LRRRRHVSAIEVEQVAIVLAILIIAAVVTVLALHLVQQKAELLVVARSTQLVHLIVVDLTQHRLQ